MNPFTMTVPVGSLINRGTGTMVCVEKQLVLNRLGENL